MYGDAVLISDTNSSWVAMYLSLSSKVVYSATSYMREACCIAIEYGHDTISKMELSFIRSKF